MSDLAMHIADALLNESDFIDTIIDRVVRSDDFVDGVAESKEETIKVWIDNAINEIDIDDLVDKAVPDISDLENKVEELEGQIDSLNERLDKQTALLEEFQKQNFHLWKNFENQLYTNKNNFLSFVNYLRSYPIIGRWINWTV